MRAALVLLLALPLVPLAGADQESGSSVGVNLGYVSPGVWNLYTFATPGGPVTLTLSWQQPLAFPFADYDLRLYVPTALDDGSLVDSELIAQSSQHPYKHHDERIDTPVGAGTYWVAVVPFQTQNERYTLTANPGDLQFAGPAVGYQGQMP